MKAVLEGNFRISSEFNPSGRVHPITGQTKPHKGIDLAGVPKGNAVYTPTDGVVILAAISSSAGNWVKIQSGNKVFVFMHLNKFIVKNKDFVKKGQQIGEVGTTGQSTGVHLHYQVEENGVAIDPKPYINF
jgi:murein DD-endopeptidase MepM/ murein hydrolase activator NlpD